MLEEDRKRDQQKQNDETADLALINMNITKIIEFSPIYKSLHINLFLNCKEEFSKHYQREKQKQAPVIMDVPPKMHESFDAFKKYLQRVTGFFIVEDHVMNTTEGLIDQRFYYELCERATQQLLSVLRRAVVSILVLFIECLFYSSMYTSIGVLFTTDFYRRGKLIAEENRKEIVFEIQLLIYLFSLT